MGRELFKEPGEEGGVLGIYAPGEEAAKLTYYGLYGLQHRGQVSAGMAVGDSTKIRLYKNLGLVAEVFHPANLEPLKGEVALGFVGAKGVRTLAEIQPTLRDSVAWAYNGCLTNLFMLQQQLNREGSLINRLQKPSLPEAVKEWVGYLEGAFSLLVMTKNQLIGLRDPRGLRPLCLGQLKQGYVLASESCALDALGAKLLGDVGPGQMVVIDQGGIRCQQLLPALKRKICLFEYIYLARRDSILEGQRVDQVRQAFGRQLALEVSLEADVVIPVPESGRTAALSYAENTGVPFKEGLTKNRYVGRTFIQPGENLRHLSVKLKFNPIKEVVAGQRVILVDDSLVRGTTARQIVKLLREAGAREVHFLVASPPVLYPCYYGIHLAEPQELLAVRYNLTEMKRYLDVDSLHFLSLEGMLSAFTGSSQGFCTACFNGHYPVAVPDHWSLKGEQRPKLYTML